MDFVCKGNASLKHRVDCGMCGVCRVCKKVVEAELSLAQYGLCPECLASAINEAREEMKCFLCNTSLSLFADHRHLFCKHCGVLISKEPGDCVRALRNGDHDPYEFSHDGPRVDWVYV